MATAAPATSATATLATATPATATLATATTSANDVARSSWWWWGFGALRVLHYWFNNSLEDTL